MATPELKQLDPKVARYLPKYQQRRLTELYKVKDMDGTSYWWAMNPNPDDDIQDEVTGHSYTLKELKYDIDEYIYSNRRLGYHY